MKPRTWMIAGIAAAVVIVAGAIVINQLPGRGAVEGAGANAPTSSVAPSPSPAKSSAPLGGDGATPNPDASGPPQSKRFTTEVIPGSGPGSALPKSTALPEPINNPLPKTASAVGSLAKGYPSSVLPVAPGTTIKNSSVATQGSHLQVTLTAKSSQSVTDVLAFYRTALAKYGMYDSSAPAPGGATALTFTRGSNSVTVTTSPVTGGTSYILYGAFTANN